MRIEYDIKLGFKDVMFRPKRSTLKSRSQVKLERTFKLLHNKSDWSGVPIMAANMDTVGTFEMALALQNHKMFTAIHKHYTLQQWSDFLAKAPAGIENHIAVSTGTSNTDYEKLSHIIAENPQLRFICIDVANGYSEHFVAFVKQVRRKFTDKVIIAGNVVTGEMVEELLLAGADIIKVGIGPGSVCTTPGDVAKAFGAGADFVMLGGMLAGHDESGGELIEKNGEKVKMFYGMSSATAMKKHAGGVAEYRASEGKTVTVPYRGKVDETVLDILGGVRSTCTYVGASQLKELSKRTTFIRVAEQENQVYSKA